jgi:hypothetical protein
MTFPKPSTLATFVLRFLIFPFVFSPFVFAQGPLPEVPVPAVSAQPASSLADAPTNPEGSHKFWDRKNKALFMAAGALNTADFAVTRSNLQNGGQELNPVVRFFGTSTPALALNFAGETAGVVSLSYLLHKTGHHKMEHLVSYVNIASSASAVSYGLAHR